MKAKDLDIRQIIALAVLIIAAILLVAGIVGLIRTKAKNKGISAQAPMEAVLVQAPMEAVLLYYKNVPLRSKPNVSEEEEDMLIVPEGEQCGYLTEGEIGGVRITPDESVWIVVIGKDGNWRSVCYAPLRYFDISPTAGYPYLNRVKYHWSNLTPRGDKYDRHEIDYLR